MKMIATGNMVIIKKIDSGKDYSGESWSNFIAISCEQTEEEIKKNGFYILKTYNSMAEYIENNISKPRKALVSGELKLEKYNRNINLERDVNIENDVYTVDLSTSIDIFDAVIYVNTCTF